MNKYFYYGSKSSIDNDIALLIDKPIVIIQKAHLFIKEWKKNHSFADDVNLFTVKNSVIDWTFKGYEAEFNNSLYLTYHLHKQKYFLPIQRIVQENLIQRTSVMIIRILIYLKQFKKYHSICKQTINSLLVNNYCPSKQYILNGINILQNILRDNIIYSKITLDLTKLIAFQIGKTFGLLNNKILTTKEDIEFYLPQLKLYIKRKKEFDDNMFKICNDLLNIIKKKGMR